VYIVHSARKSGRQRREAAVASSRSAWAVGADQRGAEGVVAVRLRALCDGEGVAQVGLVVHAGLLHPDPQE
jgi:hypothetical protein